MANPMDMAKLAQAAQPVAAKAAGWLPWAKSFFFGSKVRTVATSTAIVGAAANAGEPLGVDKLVAGAGGLVVKTGEKLNPVTGFENIGEEMANMSEKAKALAGQGSPTSWFAAKGEKSELSGQAALIFGGLAGLIGLVGGWVSGAPTGTLALLAGGLAVVGAMGGAALGGETVKGWMTPSSDKAPADNAKGTAPEQAQAAEAAAAAAQKAAAEAAAKKPATEQKTAMFDESNPNKGLPTNQAMVDAQSKKSFAGAPVV